ncbi:MAG TPA: crosslink repair DNA glycosylase YcaQ family protein, partial [Candidatus Manganitrophaceae bacterium]|nr:crosslink repair DNA glycosylase YcaQ family protein [Candidatus Manganitrophaceae bacterium]
MAAAARPDLSMDPPFDLPAGARVTWDAEEAEKRLVRGRMEAIGPVSSATLAASLGLTSNQIRRALEALEGDGSILRGRFTPEGVAASDPDETVSASAGNHSLEVKEWVSRRLLARIHRLTLDRLRRGMAPVAPEALIRFLLDWSHLTPENRLQGKEGVLKVIEQLQGFEIPASAWERDILPNRVANYDPKWLDALCLWGEVAWGRTRLGAVRGASRILPISLMLREDIEWLRLLNGASTETLGGDARRVLSLLSQRGALFFNEIVSRTGLLPAQADAALWELAASGWASGDGFGAIRSLTSPVRREADRLLRRLKRRGGKVGAARRENGRWWAIDAAGEDRAEGDARSEEKNEFWARQLLERYGVFFRDLLTREGSAPPWKELLPIFRRLESRGEIRGGRFITGVGGEQFALPETVDLLRRARGETPPEALILLSAADPMNLAGVLTPGPKVKGAASNAVVYRGGKPVGNRQANKVWTDPTLPPETARMVERALKSGKIPQGTDHD